MFFLEGGDGGGGSGQYLQVCVDQDILCDHYDILGFFGLIQHLKNELHAAQTGQAAQGADDAIAFLS